MDWIIILLSFVGIAAVAWLFYRYYDHHPPTKSKTFVPRSERGGHVFVRLATPTVAMTALSSLLWLHWIPLSILVPVFLLYLVIIFFLPWLSGRFKSMTIGLGILEGLLLIAALVIHALFPQGKSLALAPLMLVYLLLPITALIGFFAFFVPNLVPIPAGASVEEVRKMSAKAGALFAAFFSGLPKPIIAVEKGTLERRNDGNPFLGSGPGLVMTAPEYAVLIRDGAKVRRVVGPGVIFTEGGDVADYCFDLRNQARATRVRARTQDRIEVEAPLSALFHLQRGDGERAPQLDAPWPYRPSAALKLYFSLLVDPEGKTPLEARLPQPWQDLPLKEAEPLLRQILSRYTLDEIYGAPAPNQSGRNVLLRVQIGAEVREKITRSMKEKGIHLVGGGIGGAIKPIDASIFEQRIKAWQAQWAQKAIQREVEESVIQLNNFNRARQRILQEVLASLREQAQKLQQQKEKGKELSTQTLLSLHLLETFENMATRSEAQAILPEGLLKTLDELHHRMLTGNGESTSTEEA